MEEGRFIIGKSLQDVGNNSTHLVICKRSGICGSWRLRSNEFKIGEINKLAAVKTAYHCQHILVVTDKTRCADWTGCICAVVVERNGKKCIVDLYKTLTSDEFLEFSTPSKSKSHGPKARRVRVSGRVLS